MKTMRVRDNIQGKTTKVKARKTYQTKSGKWIAEVDEAEFNEACLDVCRNVKGCKCDNLHVEADLDDDGKVYRVSTRPSGEVSGERD